MAYRLLALLSSCIAHKWRLQVFKIISERLPRVQGYLDPVGYSSLICGFANARFYDEPIMQLLTENMSAVGNVFSIQAWIFPFHSCYMQQKTMYSAAVTIALLDPRID